MPAAPPAVTDLSTPTGRAAASRLLADATAVLLVDARALDDAAVAAPSLLPGWSRGHVLAHVARNADGIVNLLTAARTGEPVPMYGPGTSRDDDIEAGSGRPAGEQADDVARTAERLDAAVARLPADRWSVVVEGRAGTRLPAHDLLWMRLREVAYHHVDLDVGRTFDRLDPGVVARGLAECPARLEAGGVAGTTWRVTDPGPAASLELAGGGPEVSGPAAALLAWATGRSDGAGLRSDRPLPVLPSWG